MSLSSSQTVFLALGSNLGDRLSAILNALDLLGKHLQITAISSIYESPPWGYTDQPAFLNCALKARTNLSPRSLLELAKSTEKALGRKPRPRWHEREIDIDILLYGDLVVREPDLTIPHAHLRERDFFLIPLIELDESLTDPLTGVKLKEYAERLETNLKPYACVLQASGKAVSGRPHGT